MGYLYKPSPWGNRFHNLTVDEALGAGSAGPGKSVVLLWDPIAQVKVEHDRCKNRSHPHRLDWGDSTGWALHLRRTRPMLDLTISRSKRAFPKIDPGAKFDSEKTTWHFSSGYRYQFGHCKDPDSWEQYMSSEFSWIGFDELVQFTKEQYDQISGRARSSDPVLRKMVKVRSMSNPVMRVTEMQGVSQKGNPHWVRDYFVAPHRDGEKILKTRVVRPDGREEFLTRIYLPARLSDNPDKTFVDDYERKLLGKPEHIRRALLDGDWWVVPGAFYTSVWRPRLHIRPTRHVDPSWPRFRSMDWGFKNPGTVLWWVMDPDDNLICERERTFKGKTDAQVAEMIRETEQMMGLWKGRRSTITGPADTQLWEQRGNSGKSMAEVMAEHGVNWVPADKRSRTMNAQRILKRLGDHRSGTTDPGLMFMDCCRMCIETLPGIQTDPNDLETPVDGGDDHWHDAIGYACAFASHGRSGIPRLGRVDDDEDSWENRDRYRGRDGYGSRL